MHNSQRFRAKFSRFSCINVQFSCVNEEKCLKKIFFEEFCKILISHRFFNEINLFLDKKKLFFENIILQK